MLSLLYLRNLDTVRHPIFEPPICGQNSFHGRFLGHEVHKPGTSRILCSFFIKNKGLSLQHTGGSRYKVQEEARYKVQEGVLYKVQSPFFREIFQEEFLS